MTRALTLLLFLCCWPLAVAAQESQDDVGYLTGLLQDALSGDGRIVEITGFEGALSSEARIERLTIADQEGVWLRMEGLQLNWRRVALADRRVVVNALTAETLEVLRRPEEASTAVDTTEADAEGSQSLADARVESSGFRLPQLPVSVEIGEFAIDEVRLAEDVTGEAAVLSVDGHANLIEATAEAGLNITRLDDPGGQFTLSLDYREETGQLALNLALEEPEGGVAARALDLPDYPALSLTGNGEGPVDDWRFDLSFKAAGVERVGGSARIEAVENGHRFSADFSGDLAPLIAPNYAAFLGNDLRLSARGLRRDDERLILDDFRLGAAHLDFSGGLVLAPSGLPERIAITGNISDEGRPVALPFAAGTEVEEAVLALRFDASRSDRWQGAIRLRNYDSGDVDFDSALLSGDGRLVITPGAESFSGDIRFETEALWLRDEGLFEAIGEAPTGQVHLVWREDDPFVFRDLTAEVAAGKLQTTGAVRWAGRRVYLSAIADLETPRLDRLATLTDTALAGDGRVSALVFYQPLNGAIDLRLSGQADGLQLGIDRLDPLLAEGRAGIELSAERNETGLDIRRLSLVNPGLSLSATGQVQGEAVTANANLRLENAAIFTGGQAGPVALQAELESADREIWNWTLQGEGRDAGIGQPILDRHLVGQSSFSARGQVDGNVVRLDETRLDAPMLQADLSGRIEENIIDLSLTANLPNSAQWAGRQAGPLSLRGSATRRSETWRFDLQGDGRDLGIGQDNVDRLIRGPGRLSVTGGLRDGVVDLEQASLTTPGLQMAAFGRVGGGQNDLTFTAALADLGVLVEEFPGPARMAGQVQSQGNAIDVSADIDAPGGTEARLQGRIRTDPLRTNLTVNGRAPLGLANPFIEPRLASGQARFDLSLDGTPGLDALSGSIDISEGQISDPGLGRRIEALNGRLRLAQGRLFPDLTASLPEGGDVAVSGSLALAPPFEAALQIDLDDLDIVQPGLFETTAEGALSLRGPLQGAGGTVNGNIRFGVVEARIPDGGGGASGAPAIPDMVHIGDSSGARLTRQRAGIDDASGSPSAPRSSSSASSRGGPDLQIALIAADRVFLRGRGVDAEFGGRVDIGGRPGDLRPSGGFELVRGRINLLGQRLELTEGRVTLLGDLTPEIRLVAETSFVDGIAQLVLEGPVNEPEISFSSSPALPEDEIIARIFFGVPISELSPFQLAQIAGGIAALTGGGTEGPLSQARERLGLDDLDLTSDEEGRPGISAGAYVTENAYTNVEVQGDGTTQLTINVDIGNGLTLRGRSSSDGDNGLGLFFERDY